MQSRGLMSSVAGLPDARCESIYSKLTRVRVETADNQSTSVFSAGDWNQEEFDNWVMFTRRYMEKAEGRKMKQRQRYCEEDKNS